MNRRSFLRALVTGSIAAVAAVVGRAPRQVAGPVGGYSIGVDHGAGLDVSTVIVMGHYDGQWRRVDSGEPQWPALGAPSMGDIANRLRSKLQEVPDVG